MNLNLQTTLLGGQAFNWEYKDNKYYGFTHNGLIIIDDRGSIQQINETMDIDKYLGKDLDLEELYFYNKANKINYKQDKYQSRAPIFFSSEARINPFNINSNKNEY